MISGAVVDGGLVERDRCLFSEGVRSNFRPRRQDESAFTFLNRVRQPAFERERRWWELAYQDYPEVQDKVDLAARFRHPDDTVHLAAAWELAQHRLWRALGWRLTPHPDGPGSHRRDYLVAKEGETSFFLECVVDFPSAVHEKSSRRWASVYQAIASLHSPAHHLHIERYQIGAAPLAFKRHLRGVQLRLDALGPYEAATVLSVDEAGWSFEVRALPIPGPRTPSVGWGGSQSIKDRLYTPIRRKISKKAEGASDLDGPYLIALLVVGSLPIVDDDDAVEGALFGMPITEIGSGSEPRRLTNAGNGVWYGPSGPRLTSVSAVALQEGVLTGTTPTLHHHPAARHPFTPEVPLRVVRYRTDGETTARRVSEATATPQEILGLPPEWPGPENYFEGINTANPTPTAEFWSPLHESARP